jgi:PAS domain S-box-containing protein
MPQDVLTEEPEQAALRFRAEALAQVGDAVIIIDQEQRITYLNAKAAAQYAVEPAAALGRPLSSLYQHLWLKPSDEEAAFRTLGQGDNWQGENIHVLPDGKQLHVESTVSVLKDHKGQPAGMLAVIRDITERKQAEKELRRLAKELRELNETLEQRVAARTAELERSNRELDRFAYIASHDLKAPLRAIEHLADWVAEDSSGTLSPVSQEHLARLRGRARRLDRLLDALLYYSRAGRRRHAPQVVDTAALVRSVAELLNPPDGFQVVIEGDLPPVYCERPSFETLLRNLIENAVKHHDRPQEGTVTVSAATRGNFVEFHVRDDGPGIDPQYHARIFEVFQTLRPRDEVEGSGMGLAIAKKTVESAGGEIWVESAVGKGATFCFSWPLRATAAAARAGSPPLIGDLRQS